MKEHHVKGLRILRLAILVSLLVGSIELYSWSRSADPRFFLFLESPLGRELARLFRWRGQDVSLIPRDKPESEMTAAELAVKRRLEKVVRENLPSHRLILKTGKVMEGRLVETKPDYVLFEESYGSSGVLRARIARSRIDHIERLKISPPRITYRDVLFQMEFPRMKLYKHPPYTIVTDESYFQVQRSVRTLRDLYTEVMRVFGPLMERGRRGKGLQILFFSDREAYLRYQKHYRVKMEETAGFYSPWLDRLVIFNEVGSAVMKDLAADLHKQEEELRRKTQDARQRSRIGAYRRRVERNLLEQAEEKTFVTLRHEGAHQLFFSYGVHSSFRAENEWLVEGLAVYCETPHLGEPDPRRIKRLRRAMDGRRFIGLQNLVNFRHVRGFFAMGEGRVDLAYSEAWSLVHYLMSEADLRNCFFEYIRYIRDPRHLDVIVRKPRVRILCRFLHTDSESLEKAWLDHIRRM